MTGIVAATNIFKAYIFFSSLDTSSKVINVIEYYYQPGNFQNRKTLKMVDPDDHLI